MKPATKRRLGLALQLVLLAVVAVVVWRRLAPALAGVSRADFARYRPSPGLLVAATVGLTALHLMQAYLWRRVLVDVGAPPPDARTSVRVYFMAGLARFIPGSVWQFAGYAVLGQQAGIPPLAANAAYVIGNLAFMVMGVLFLALTLPGAAGVAELLLTVLALAAVAVVAILFSASPAGSRLRGRLAGRAPERLKPVLELAGHIRPGRAATWMLGYGVCWLLLAASFSLFVGAFVPAALPHWRQLGGIMAASFLGGVIVLVAPAGLGVREGIMVSLLAAIVPAPAAVLVAVAHRLWFLVAEMLALSTFPLWPGGGGSATPGAPGDGVGGRGEARMEAL